MTAFFLSLKYLGFSGLHMATRNYTYYDFTLSLCSACLERVDAKIVFQDDNVFMLKNCLDHGPEKTLISRRENGV